jgi:hypothetical protein
MSCAESSAAVALLCLRVSTDGDPGVLTRLLGYFQNLNITPRQIVAEFGSDQRLHLRVDVAGIAEERLSRIAGRIGASPAVFGAYWHYL